MKICHGWGSLRYSPVPLEVGEAGRIGRIVPDGVRPRVPLRRRRPVESQLLCALSSLVALVEKVVTERTGCGHCSGEPLSWSSAETLSADTPFVASSCLSALRLSGTSACWRPGVGSAPPLPRPCTGRIQGIRPNRRGRNSDSTPRADMRRGVDGRGAGPSAFGTRCVWPGCKPLLTRGNNTAARRERERRPDGASLPHD